MLRGETPEEKNFVISADDAQRIYRHQGRSDFTWASLNIPMRGRSKVLRRVYRNSARVWTFAGFLLGNIAHYYPDDDGNVSANIEFAPKPGNDPQLIECKSPRDQIQEVIKTISEIIAQGYATRNVLILYRGVRVNGYPLVERLTQALERHAIPYQWITENAEAKATFRWNDNKVKISTVHSAKGMDAPVVIIIGAEAFGSQLETSNADEKKLMYVAMTRAREYLKILYTGDGGLIPYLKNCEDMYTRHRQRILKVEQMSLTEINL